MDTTAIEIRPLTAERWPDLETLFGPNGASSGCWCMWFRQTAAEFRECAGEQNRQALKALVEAGAQPGLLAYLGSRPAGWCSVAPREEFGRLNRSRILKAVDAEPVWSVVCFYIDRKARGHGLGAALLRAAVDHAAARGARIVEGYPVDPGDGRVDNASAFMGLVGMFREAGFEEVARRSPGRPVMRRTLG
jgi:GNAT superfamily N-acetyltransferase